MRLEASIQQLEHNARVVSRASYWGLGIIIACILLVLPLVGLGVFSKYVWARPVWSGFGLVAMFITAVLAYIYQYRFQPALDRAKSELQMTMLNQLQQQIADLSRKLESRQ